jgi:cyclophilin family peptidyl-prolyl cis-trans isomerase
MHDLILENQSVWAAQSVDDARKTMEGYAEELDLDVDQFSLDLKEGTYREVVEQATEEAGALGLRGTPSFFVNGQPYNLNRTNRGEGLDDWVLPGLAQLYSYEGPQWDTPPPMTIDSDGPVYATVETDKGSFCLELYADQTPNTVNSFVFLANEGFYDSTPFHRVLPGFVAQTGDPTGSGFGGPGYRFEDEIVDELKHDSPGLLSMANAGPGTNGSQFFITYGALPDLDGKHTVFGRVAEGMDVVESLTPRDPTQDPYAPADKIVSVSIGEACE